MATMGFWALEKYGLHHPLSTNSSESFNALLKRHFPKKRCYTEDAILLGGFKVVKRQLIRLKRARRGVGEKWLLREHLRENYSIFNNELEEDTSEEPLIAQLEEVAEMQWVR